MKKAFLCSIVFLLSTYVLVAQAKEAQPGNIYRNVKVRYHTGEYFKVKDFMLVNDSIVSFINPQSNEQITMNASNINYISIANGSYAGEYALYGGLLGFVSTLSAWSSSSQQYGYVPFDVVAPVMAGFTVGFGAIGALIGVFNVKYKRLYLPTKSNAVNYYITPNINNQFCGVSLVCKIN